MTTTFVVGRDEIPVIDKDPNAKLDYGLDWSDWLKPGDTLASATWTTDDPSLVVEPQTAKADSLAVVWLSGGTVGGAPLATCHVVTMAGREDDRSLRFSIKQR